MCMSTAKAFPVHHHLISNGIPHIGNLPRSPVKVESIMQQGHYGGRDPGYYRQQQQHIQSQPERSPSTSSSSSSSRMAAAQIASFSQQQQQRERQRRSYPFQQHQMYGNIINAGHASSSYSLPSLRYVPTSPPLDGMRQLSAAAAAMSQSVGDSAITPTGNAAPGDASLSPHMERIQQTSHLQGWNTHHHPHQMQLHHHHQQPQALDMQTPPAPQLYHAATVRASGGHMHADMIDGGPSRMQRSFTAPGPAAGASTSKRKRCKHIGCHNFAVKEGRCKAHGGFIRCWVKDCDKHAVKYGMCKKHRSTMLRHCSVQGCEKYAKVNSRCLVHSRDATLAPEDARAAATAPSDEDTSETASVVSAAAPHTKRKE